MLAPGARARDNAGAPVSLPSDSGPADDRARALALLRAHGADAVSFEALKPGLRHWFDPAGDALVAYFDTGSAWVGAGGPVAPAARRGEVARAFVAAARAHGRRASFFAVEQTEGLDGFEALLLGEQAVWIPAAWNETLAGQRKLREQLRRARAKQVVVRCVGADELADGSALRRELEALTAAWLGTRHMEPLRFIITLAPFEHPREHRYFVAERAGRVVGLLSAVPVFARSSWLLEDLLRAADAPNGTTELLVDAALRALANEGAQGATMGLAPLSGGIAWPLRVARTAGKGLYDFAGLRAFKQRLHPTRWERVHLAYPAGQSPIVHVYDTLRAFAAGSIVAFGLRTLARRPSAAPWVVGVTLIPWTLLLVVLLVTHHARWLGFEPLELAGWGLVHALLAVVLLGAALRPRRTRLAALAAVASLVALLWATHVVGAGFGITEAAHALRAVSTGAPIVASAVLWWSAWAVV